MGLAISNIELPEPRVDALLPTPFDAFLTVGFVASAATVANISASGARIECHQPLRVGMTISLKANQFDVTARVVQSTEAGYDVEFSRRISPLDVWRQNYSGLKHYRR
jgi:hypothetical protein